MRSYWPTGSRVGRAVLSVPASTGEFGTKSAPGGLGASEPVLVIRVVVHRALLLLVELGDDAEAIGELDGIHGNDRRSGAQQQIDRIAIFAVSGGEMRHQHQTLVGLELQLPGGTSTGEQPREIAGGVEVSQGEMSDGSFVGPVQMVEVVGVETGDRVEGSRWLSDQDLQACGQSSERDRRETPCVLAVSDCHDSQGVSYRRGPVASFGGEPRSSPLQQLEDPPEVCTRIRRLRFHQLTFQLRDRDERRFDRRVRLWRLPIQRPGAVYSGNDSEDLRARFGETLRVGRPRLEVTDGKQCPREGNVQVVGELVVELSALRPGSIDERAVFVMAHLE